MKTLKEIRMEAGITQAEAAKRIGVNRVYYCDIENGKRKNMEVGTVLKIANAFNIGIDEVLKMVV